MLALLGLFDVAKHIYNKIYENTCVAKHQRQNEQQRAVDELPQSATGKTIMTTQPRFVSNEAVEIKVDDSTEFNVCMIDCGGHLFSGPLDTLKARNKDLSKNR